VAREARGSHPIAGARTAIWSRNLSHTYGGGLALNEVLVLTPSEYKETLISQIAPADPYYCDGIHTIAGAGQFTLIDGKRWHTELLPNLFRKIVAKTLRTRRRLLSIAHDQSMELLFDLEQRLL
jgi:hypothetical protein